MLVLLLFIGIGITTCFCCVWQGRAKQVFGARNIIWHLVWSRARVQFVVFETHLVL